MYDDPISADGPAIDADRTAIDDPEVPGLAGERTDLAWSRTMLSAVVAAGAVLRRVWGLFDHPTAQLIVFSILGVGAIAWLVSMRVAEATARSTIEGRRGTATEHSLRGATIGTVLFAVAALILAAVPA